MSIIGNNMLAGASGHGGYKISRSLRFNGSSDSTHLTRTPSSASNSTTFTWSAWIKVDTSTAVQNLFSATSSNTLQYDFSLVSNQLNVFGIETVFVWDKKLSRVFRDPSAWYHLVVAFDTTDSTAEDRIKIYVNGERETDFATNTNPSASRTTGFNKTVEHSIGGRTGYSTGQYFDGYQTEINFIDGSQLGPENFGKTDPVTGAWIPKKYNGSYGTNGFFLSFSDNSDVTAPTLGRDSSGNGNNWTPNNFSVTAGAGNDSLEDTPTNNWCTWNPLAKDGGTTYSNGILDISSANYGNNTATFFLTSGKWYWEGKGSGYIAAICGRAGQNATGSISTSGSNSIGYWEEGPVYWDGGNNSGTISYTSSDVIGTALDMDNGIVRFYKNGAFAYTIVFGSGTVPDLSDGVFPCYNNGASSTIRTAVYNFGQRAFDYTPPTGYKALNTANLPLPTIKNGTKYFNTVLWTGNSSTQAITGVGFQPDFVWGKARSVGYAHNLFDVVRGATKSLVSSSTAAEITVSGLTSFDSDGFTLGSNLDLNLTTHTYVAWNWKAGGSGSANTDGTISSTVSVNADAGFSIVEYTGNSTAGATVGHGLDVAPKVIITKTSSTNLGNWGVYHYGVDATSPEDYMLNLNLTNGRTDSALWWNDTAPTSTVFTIGTSNDVNGSSDYIAYCFAEVEGYSKFGSYEGNGSSDGTFIALPFKPAFFMLKDVDRANTRWIIMDNVRDPFNVAYHVLSPNSAAAEDESTSYWLADFVSNGVKLRYGADNEFNKSGDTYIYMAFSSVPFKYANAR